jgi:hypothetical protein
VISSVSRARPVGEQVYFIRARARRRVSQDQAFNGWVYFHDLMIDSSRKATKLAWTDGHPFSFYLNNDGPLKHQQGVKLFEQLAQLE